MAQLKISSPGLPAPRDTARQLIEQAGGELVYLSLIACVIWLLIKHH